VRSSCWARRWRPSSRRLRSLMRSTPASGSCTSGCCVSAPARAGAAHASALRSTASRPCLACCRR